MGGAPRPPPSRSLSQPRRGEGEMAMTFYISYIKNYTNYTSLHQTYTTIKGVTMRVYRLLV